MTKQTSITELRRMQIKDLLGEIRAQEHTVSKLRLGVKLRKEKDTAKYRGEKRQLARMCTVLAEKQTEELPAQKPGSTVSVSQKSAAKHAHSPSKKS